jgi:hypothetical protein
MTTPGSMSTPTAPTPGALPSPPATPPNEQLIPYFEGASFTATRHDPPTMFEMGYDDYSRDRPIVPDDALQLDWCLTHPPAPGITRTEDTRRIEIVKAIRTGEGCGAQVVLTADGYVAKVFDPLYYKFPDPMGVNWKVNVTDVAEEEYITEATVYSQLLDTSLQGSIMPKYYGSWSLNIPLVTVGQQLYREVRMIIIEYVTGISMLNIDPTTLTQQARENVMIKLIEGDIDLRFEGVLHDDLEPRNVILPTPESSFSYEDPGLRVCVIDFGWCALFRNQERIGPDPQFFNPLHYWISSAHWSDYGWLPPQEEAWDWMWKLWGNGGQDGKYVKAERDPDSARGKPKKPTKKDTGRIAEPAT